MSVYPQHLFAPRSRQLTPREEKMGAGRRFRDGRVGIAHHKRAFRAVGRGHIFQSKLVSRGRHISAFHHLPPGGQTEIGHGKIFGADGFALAAQAAPVDQAVGQVLPLDDSPVVVNLTGENLGIAFVMLHIGAFAHAGHALAAQTAGGFGPAAVDVVIAVCGFDTGHGLHSVHGRPQTGVGEAFFLAGGGQRHAGDEALQRGGCPAALGGAVYHRIALQPAAVAQGGPSFRQRFGLQKGHGVQVGAESGQMGRAFGIHKHGVERSAGLIHQSDIQGSRRKSHGPAPDDGQFIFKHGGIVHAQAGQQRRTHGGFGMEYGDGVTFAPQIPGHGQPREPVAHHGHAFVFARYGQGTGLAGGSAHAQALQGADGQRAAELPAQATRFTGMIAYPAEQARQRHVPFQNFTATGQIGGGHAFHEGTRVHLQRAGRPTIGHFFLNTAALPGVKFLLVHISAPRSSPCARGKAAVRPRWAVRRSASCTGGEAAMCLRGSLQARYRSQLRRLR